MKKILLLFVLFFVLNIFISGYSANSPYYEGETIRIIVPHGPGGGFDTYARMIQPFLEEYLPGSKVIVENIPGAGGEIGRNLAFMAKPDGYTICLTAGNDMVFNTIAGSESVKYKIDEWTYLARINAEPSILTASARSEYDSFEDIVHSEEVLSFSCSGVGDADYFALGVTAHVFDFQLLPVTGYSGSKEASLAVVRGEVDLWQPSLGTALPLINNEDVKAIAIYSQERESMLPEVPTLLEIAVNEKFGLDEIDRKLIQAMINVNEVRRLIIAPPGMDERKTVILREAINKTLNDPKLVGFSKQINRSIAYMEGEKVAELIKEIMEIKEIIKPILENTLKLAQ